MAMKTAFVVLMTLALILTGLGLFGITDYLISMPGWEAAKKSTPPGLSPSSPLGRASQDYIDSLDRARNIGLIFSLLSFVGGLGLGICIWVCRNYIWRRSVERILSSRGGEKSVAASCNICGAKLSLDEKTRGVCDFCRKRGG
jgi:hypothetical protein